MSTYPYWLVITRHGKIPVPLEYRGTVIAKEFISGRIGGVSLTEKTFTNPKDTLASFYDAKRRNEKPEVYVIEGRNQPRMRLQYPEQVLSSKFTIIGQELLSRPTCKLLLNNTAVAFFLPQSQHNSIKVAGLSYEDDYKGNALAGICSERRIELRYHKEFSDVHVQQILTALLKDIPQLRNYSVSYQGRPISFA